MLLCVWENIIVPFAGSCTYLDPELNKPASSTTAAEPSLEENKQLHSELSEVLSSPVSENVLI